ncbi:ArsA family ATPase [Kutzneria albida]|uniref:Arsenite-transporting ATPase n=1 Tax=Kutzneria albida DSM 43870 TaxID=1449976 RepID=W5W2E9_9PSEU|nr:ArsA family ATPase [Kutzneria albida]AHH95358.1 arsenite-transporting ATPase [Kutzneria albida DSM 43870]
MKVLLFTGKGGVGKTTLAAATAAALVEGGRKALVVSTDPAHSLADAIGHELGSAPTEIGDGLCGAQIDTRGLVDGAWQEIRDHLRTLLAGAGVDELDAEELTVLPGVEELLALTEVHRLAASGLWDVVVVDCGPTAETLRLLALPEAVAGYLERLFPTHRRVVRGLLAGMAGSATVERWDSAADAIGRLSEHLAAVRQLLVDHERTSVRLVLTPERVVAAETRRTLTALALQGIRVDGMIANRLVPDAGAAKGAAAGWLRTRRAEQETVLAELRAAELPVRTVGHRACEPVGLPALRELAAELYPDGEPLATEAAPEARLLTVTGDGGRGLDASYELRVALPLAADSDLDLARVDEELSITVDGRRRLVALPAVLRRCEVTGARLDDEGLVVGFRPDPRLWMR